MHALLGPEITVYAGRPDPIQISAPLVGVGQFKSYVVASLDYLLDMSTQVIIDRKDRHTIPTTVAS